jgi:predicted nuclease of predicted toxin-antitoxin system
MRILIDECLDWRLKREFPGHAAMTVTDMGWGGIKNGALLSIAQSQFDVFVTGDRNLQFQNVAANYSIAVVVFASVSTRLDDTLPLVPKLLGMLNQLQPGTVTIIHP